MVEFAKHWLDLLAQGRLEEACGLLVPNHYGVRWSPTQLRQLVDDTFVPGTLFRQLHPTGPVFSAPGAAVGDPGVSVVAFADESGYSVEHAVPLNGEFSDLTAQFEFRKTASGYELCLHDLHVR